MEGDKRHIRPKNVAYKVYVLRKPGEATMVAGKLTAGRNMALNETAVMDQRKEVVREMRKISIFW